MWLAVLPVAMAPLWHEEQLPSTCAWSTRVTGCQVDVAWQLSQAALDLMWEVFLPVARTPSWQLAQLAVMPVWSKPAGRHAIVVWHELHSEVVATWFAFLPEAMAPLWHDEQVPNTCM
jgi:hypothetical protein